MMAPAMRVSPPSLTLPRKGGGKEVGGSPARGEEKKTEGF
jgi:hypothetical protein